MQALIGAISDLIKFMQKTNSGCSKDYFAITPNDNTDLPKNIRAISIGTDGNLTVKNPAGTNVTFAVLKGQVISISTTRVMATGTTATGLVGLV